VTERFHSRQPSRKRPWSLHSVAPWQRRYMKRLLLSLSTAEWKMRHLSPVLGWIQFLISTSWIREFWTLVWIGFWELEGSWTFLHFTGDEKEASEFNKCEWNLDKNPHSLIFQVRVRLCLSPARSLLCFKSVSRKPCPLASSEKLPQNGLRILKLRQMNLTQLKRPLLQGFIDLYLVPFPLLSNGLMMSNWQRSEWKMHSIRPDV
jgi:hypothetical protein